MSHRFPVRLSVRRRLKVETLTDRRVLAAITGTVFDDVNHSLRQDDGESGALSRLVYIDANDNATLDVGEKIALANDSGEFEFLDLDDGTYQVRLFNGSNSQVQTVPVGTEGIGPVFDVADASSLIASESALHLISGDSIVTVDPNQLGGDGTTVRIADSIKKMQRLPNGSLLVIGSDLSGETAWVFDPANGSSSPADLSGAEVAQSSAMLWSELAIDGNGRGVVLEQAQAGESSVEVRSIDASDDSGIVVSMTSTFVPTETTVVASATGSRSVFAWPATEGLELSLWSNSTDSFISDATVLIDDALSLLSFDDQSGLIALRTSGGGVRIVDANNNFQSLHYFADQTGPVVIDGERDLMFAYASDATSLQVVDLNDATLLNSVVSDLGMLGSPTSIVVGSDPTSLILHGTSGVSEIRLDKPTAREITIADGINVTDVVFGVSIEGSNSPPRYEMLPSFQVNEDAVLTESAPGALEGAVDDENDQFVLINSSGTSNGLISVGLDGALIYTPNPDFAGDDAFGVMLHDGRDLSDEVMLEIFVSPLPDGPTGIDITINPVPEDLEVGMPIGDIEVIDVDGPGHFVEIDDTRFGIDDGAIIFTGGQINFETEPLIPINVTVTDSQTGDIIEESITVMIEDANDPITGIVPTEAFVFENAVGDLIAGLRVLDEDEEQFHTLVVDDDRFMIEGIDLRLAQGVSLDYETDPEVIVNVTATEIGGTNSFTEAITVTVRDIFEQPAGIGLSNGTVLELSEGAEVGAISLNGSALDNRYSFFTDDIRFEVIDGVLKLRDNQIVNRDEEIQIDVEVTMVDTLGEFETIVEAFSIEVLENQTPAHNDENPFDVNHVGGVGALDALVIINYLNEFGPGPVGTGDLTHSYDVNADGIVSALDALLVLNYINATSGDGGGTVGGEEESDGGLSNPPEGEQSPLPSPQLNGQPLRSFRIVQETPSVISDTQFANLFLAAAESDQRVRSQSKINSPSEGFNNEFDSIIDSEIGDLHETIELLSKSKE